MKSYYWIILLSMLTCNLILFTLIMQEAPQASIPMRDKNNANNFSNNENYLLYESLDTPIEDLFLLENQKSSIKKPLLIFRYNIEACTPCISNVISAVEKVFPDYKTNDNIIFSCKGLNPKLNNKISPKKHYSFQDSTMIAIPIDQYNVPYLFVLDKDLRLKYLFIVYSKDNEQNIIDYLNLAKKKFNF